MFELSKLPIDSKKIETINILKAETRAAKTLAELKGIANIIPNQMILINAIVLQESKDSSGIENIITTKDELYKTTKNINSATKEVMFYLGILLQSTYMGVSLCAGQRVGLFALRRLARLIPRLRSGLRCYYPLRCKLAMQLRKT